MKTADDSFVRSLPALAATALISAVSVVVLAVLHAQLTGDSSQPAAAAGSVKQKSRNLAVNAPSSPKPLPSKQLTSEARNKELPEKTPAIKTQPEHLPVEQPLLVTNLPPTNTPAKTLLDNSLVSKLEQARADYQRERKEYFTALEAELTKRDKAAQGTGDAELIKQAQAAREAFAKGLIPKEVPGILLSKMMSVREELAKALQRELRTAEQKRDESQIAALRRELRDFMIEESAEIGDINVRFPDCTFRLINVATELALAAHDEGNGAAVIQTKENPADPLQHWYVKYKGQWFERVRLRKNGRNLNVPASDRASGRHIIMWQEEDQANGYWELKYRGTYYHLRSLFSGKLLSVPGAVKTDGQQLIQWDHHDTPDDQKWKLIRVLPELDDR